MCLHILPGLPKYSRMDAKHKPEATEARKLTSLTAVGEDLIANPECARIAVYKNNEGVYKSFT